MTTTRPSWIAFSQSKRLSFGSPHEVAAAVKTFVDNHPDGSVLVFDAISSEPVEIDLRGSLPEVIARLPNLPGKESSSDCATPTPPARTPGRPKLGVTAREVTLLPRHWEWLAAQPGGASVALRKLVEQALRSNSGADRIRKAREAAYRFMTAIAGNEAGHEEAVRALFAGDLEKLGVLIEHWPGDIRDHVLKLANAAD
jgi:hypothetical protein